MSLTLEAKKAIVDEVNSIAAEAPSAIAEKTSIKWPTPCKRSPHLSIVIKFRFINIV